MGSACSVLLVSTSDYINYQKTDSYSRNFYTFHPVCESSKYRMGNSRSSLQLRAERISSESQNLPSIHLGTELFMLSSSRAKVVMKTRWTLKISSASWHTLDP